MERDPVCGMMVDPAQATAKSEHGGRSYYFCCAKCAEKFRIDPEKYLQAAAPEPMLVSSSNSTGPIRRNPTGAANCRGHDLPDRRPATIRVPRSPRNSPRNASGVYLCPMDPEVRQDHPGACPKCGMALEAGRPARPRHAHRIHLPDASRNCSLRAWLCPICGMALEPRTARQPRNENPELVSMTRRFWISVALTIPVLAARHVRHDPGHTRERFLSMRTIGWIEFAPRHARRALGRLAFFRARLGLARQSQSEYVHADRARHRHGLRLQRDRRALSRNFSRFVPRDTARFPSISKPPPRSPRSCCSARCSNCARAAAPPRRSARLLKLSPKTARLVRADGTEIDVPIEHIESATRCACAPAKKFPSMAS